MDKYYTPEIEEFHKGFEYEVFEKGQVDDPSIMTFMPVETEDKWYKFKYPDPFLGYHLGKLFEKTLRVKYLDRGDIESFGFEFEGGKLIRNRGDNYRLGSTLIYHRGVDNFIRIGNTFGDNIFRGVIKNKSEFKRLLIQLDINIDERA